VKLTYIFPEPLPLPRARGIQVAHTIACLAKFGVSVDLFHAPGDGDPFGACGVAQPEQVVLGQIKRSLCWPLQRIQSNRIFFYRLRSRLAALPAGSPVMVRHIKLAAMLVRELPHLAVVYEAHEVFSETAAASKRARIQCDESVVMSKAAAVVTNSRATAEGLRNRYPFISCPMEVIPNGVDLPVHLGERDWQRPQDRVIYTGAFFGWKGVADLVSAAAELPGFRIRLIGGDVVQAGKLLGEAPPAKAELQFEDRKPHSEIMAALSASCIAVLPNRPDTDSRFTSPIKLFEYMGAGCAVVASDLPSIREILDENDAYWFAPGNPHALATALRLAVENPERTRLMGERVREKAENYTWQARARRLHALIQRVVR
jgi:glycosyltransferase involved in cell wall biosynthesis